ncbi:zf-CCHC domain-containing protein [Tanacetum coccineum]
MVGGCGGMVVTRVLVGVLVGQKHHTNNKKGGGCDDVGGVGGGDDNDDGDGSGVMVRGVVEVVSAHEEHFWSSPEKFSGGGDGNSGGRRWQELAGNNEGERETSDCAFSRFNTIITSLKALDESFSSRNHVRKFLRALPSKWRPKVTAIEESKDLSKLTLDELVGNLKVYEVVLEKDLESAKNKKQNYKSLALKARQVLSDKDASSSDSNDKEYAMAVRDFKKFFRRRGKFIRQPYDDKKNLRKVKEDKKEDEGASSVAIQTTSLVIV